MCFDDRFRKRRLVGSAALKEHAMERLTHWTAWAVVAVVVVLAGLNWSALTAPSPVQLGLTEVQAPMGLMLLGLMAGCVGLFFIATLASRVAQLVESHRLHKDLRAALTRADQAEASRLQALQHTVIAEFRALDQRLQALESALAVRRPVPASPADEPLPLVRLP
jgi:hypothetical protein